MNTTQIARMADGYTGKKKDYKQVQREQITEFVVDNHSAPVGHFLTLPHAGEQEVMIRSHKLGKHIQFTGVEIDMPTAVRLQHRKNGKLFKRLIIDDIFDVLSDDVVALNLVSSIFTGMIIDPCSTITAKALQAFKSIGEYMGDVEFAPVVVSLCSRLRYHRGCLRDAKPVALNNMLLTKQFKLNSSKKFAAGVLKQIGAVVQALQANRGWRFDDFVAETWRGGGHSIGGIPMFTIYGVLQRR